MGLIRYIEGESVDDTDRHRYSIWLVKQFPALFIHKPKKIILYVCFLLFLYGGEAFSETQEGNIWPIYGHKIIDTHLHHWEEQFFTLNEEGELFKFWFEGDQIKKKEIYDYSKRPDIIKHFSLESGDLVVAIFKEEKKITLNGFSPQGKSIYTDQFSLDFTVELADIRINEKGQPLCLLYYYKNLNYVISIWKSGNLEEIYRIHHPIDYIFFQWKNKTIHMLHQYRNDYYWAIWSRQRYFQVKLPFHVVAPSFFSIGRYTFLVGADLSGDLWRLTLKGKRLIRSKLASGPNLRFIREIVPIVYQKTFQLIMPSRESNSVWRLQFSNFFRNIKIDGLSYQKVFWGHKIHLLNHNQKLHMIAETENSHLYLQKWNSSKTHLYNIQWDIKINPARTSLIINWETKKRADYLYHYLLDGKKTSEPIGEATTLRNNRIQINNVRDGHHVLHLQAVNIRKREKSYLYHIPIFWLYDPPEPQVIFLNTISPSTFLPGVMKFYIKNQSRIDYYVSINQKSIDKPRKLLRLRSGVAALSINLKTGWYYLHLRSRDPKSKKFSTTLHLPFSVKPFDPDSERADAEIDTIRTQIEQLQKEIKKNKRNTAKLKKIRGRLKELREKTIPMIFIHK